MLHDKFSYYSSIIIQKTQRDCSNFSDRPAVKRALNIMFDFIKKNQLIKPGDKLLDIGSGGGQVSRAFFDQFGVKNWAITIENSEINRSKKIGVQAVNSDMHDIPFEDSFFNVIYASHILEHSIAPLIALYEWKRVLSKNGTLIIWGPIGRDFKGESDGTSVYGCKDHFITPTLWQYKWLFQLSELELLYELDLPYQISSKQEEKKYNKLVRLECLLSRFKISLLPEYAPATAKLFVLKK